MHAHHTCAGEVCGRKKQVVLYRDFHPRPAISTIHPMKYPQIEIAYDTILQSSVFRTNGPRIDLIRALIHLAQAIRSTDTEEDVWNIGEFTEASLDCLLIGAYWALTEWHSGQDSPSYAALCAINEIFSPGMTNAPKEDDPEVTVAVYQLVSQWCENNKSLL